MKYCTKCVMPDTKPFLTFNKDGVCNACINHEKKKGFINTINWVQRKISYYKILNEVKMKSAPCYDILVPVSGGKDSIYQVSKALESTHRVLAVNVDYGIKTKVGKHNLSIISDGLGVDLITFRPNMKLNKRLIKIGFEEYGDPDLFSHSLLYAYPIHIANKFNIPLILHGEDSGFEYCGEPDIPSLTRKWFYKHVIREKPVIDDIHKSRLKIYDLPERINSNIMFLSYYFLWDTHRHLEIAKNYGFKISTKAEGTYRMYVGIDEKINRIHQYMKYLKFGFGRATDHACEDIRNGKMDREYALEVVEIHDGMYPSPYYVEDFCMFIDITIRSFRETLMKWDKYGVLK